MSLLRLAILVAFATVSSAIPGPVVKGCNHDNVLRAFLSPRRSVEALQFCSAYIGATPGSSSIINSTITTVVTELIPTTTTSYALATTTATKTLLCPAAPAGPTSTKICGIEAYTTLENVILAQPFNSAEDCKQLCLSNPACQSFQIQKFGGGGLFFCKSYTTSVDRNVATLDPAGEFTLWDRNCFELSPSGCSPFPTPPFPTPTPSPEVSSSSSSSTSTPEPTPEISPTASESPSPTPVTTPTSTPVPLEDLCPPTVVESTICGIEAYFVEDSEIIRTLSTSPLECHIACLRELECWSYQIGSGTGFCQLQKFSIDPSKTPNRPQTLNYDRMCRENLPDVCLEAPPDVTPTPTPVEPTPTPDVTPTNTPVPIEDVCPPPFNVNIFCNFGGYSLEERFIARRFTASPLDCHIACLQHFDCLSFQIDLELGSCQLRTQSVDGSKVPDQPEAQAYDRNCPQYLPDVCLEPEPTPSPNPTEPTPIPTPTPTSEPVCGRQGDAPSGRLIDIIPVDSPAACKQACLEIPECLGFSLTDPFQGGCGLWSIAAKDIDPPVTSGQFFYDKECIIPGPTDPTIEPPVCERQGIPSGLIESIDVGSLKECSRLCGERPQCLSYGGTLPWVGKCSLLSVKAKDIQSGETQLFFYDKACSILNPNLLDPTTKPPVCGQQGDIVSAVFEIIDNNSLSECSRACGERPQCLSFAGTVPWNFNCLLSSVEAKDIKASMGEYFYYDKSCLIVEGVVFPPAESPQPKCNPSPTAPLVCRLEGSRADSLGLIDSAPVEKFIDCKEYCAVEPDCFSFSIDQNNRCKLWPLKPDESVSLRSGVGTFFYDRACVTDTSATQNTLPPCVTPTPTVRKRQLALPSYIPATVPASRITSACDCLVRMPGYTLSGVVLVTQTIFENTTITRTTTIGALQTETVTLTATAFGTAAP